MVNGWMKVSDFQSDVVIDQSNKKISGTLHYHNSSHEGQSGYYLIISFDPNWKSGITGFETMDNVERPIYTKFNVELIGGTETIVETVTLGTSNVVLSITDPKTQKIKVTCFKESSAVYTEIFSLTDLVLEPKA